MGSQSFVKYSFQRDSGLVTRNLDRACVYTEGMRRRYELQGKSIVEQLVSKDRQMISLNGVSFGDWLDWLDVFCVAWYCDVSCSSFG